MTAIELQNRVSENPPTTSIGTKTSIVGGVNLDSLELK
jgi:hypothetical protein